MADFVDNKQDCEPEESEQRAASRKRHFKWKKVESGQSPILVILVALIAAALVFVAVPFDRSAEMYIDGEYGRDVVVKASLSSRTIGLLTAGSENSACVLEGASAIHCFGMRWPIDVVYLYDSNVIFVETVSPGNLGTQGIPANKVLELPAGQASALGLSEDAQVTFA